MYPSNPHSALQFSINYPPLHNPAQANTDMFNAIQYARDEDFLKLLETALSHGASIDALNHTNFDVLTVAVNANQPNKIQSLFAKGAKLPVVSNDGKDLLMIAAEQGRAKLVSILIEIDKFDIESVDCHGQTALHYAVNSGDKETVEVLLKNNVNTEAYTTSFDADELLKYFDARLGLGGENITPLMIAVAKSDKEIVEHLLKNNADPDCGACMPLAVALSKNDNEMMALLIENGAEPFYTEDSNGDCLMTNAISRNHSIECLRLFAKYIPSNLLPAGRSSILGIAVKNGNKHAIAFLLACGYKPKDQTPEKKTIWDLALNLENAQDILSLMAASRSDDWESADIMLIFGLLEKLPVLSKCSADLASEGLFPEIFTHCLPQLQAAANGEAVTEISSSAQLGLRAAHALFHFGELDVESDALNNTIKKNAHPDIKWIAAIPGKKNRQAQLLLSVAGQLLGDMQEKLTQIMSLDFFLECVEACPEHINFSSFIFNKLREEAGIPDAISKAIGIAWQKAAKSNVKWQIAPNSLDDANRFVAHLAASMLEIQLNETDVTGNPLLAECKSFMLEKLHEHARPLISFCTNPVIWLRQQEGRNNLRPVNVEALASAMQIELALPPALCRSIAQGWARAVRQAQQSNALLALGDIQRLLAKSLAQVLAELMQAGPDTKASADFPIPATLRLQLLRWCEQAGTPVGIALSNTTVNRHGNNPQNNSLRRAAEGEAPGAPPNKKPRI